MSDLLFKGRFLRGLLLFVIQGVWLTLDVLHRFDVICSLHVL